MLMASENLISHDGILVKTLTRKILNFKVLKKSTFLNGTLMVLSGGTNRSTHEALKFLYNNFKIVEQEVKRTATTSLSSGSQNMAFVSTLSSTNEVNTTNVQVSTANSSVGTDSTLDSTANLSDATVYAFLANQLNGSQLVHEDLKQIHKDDLEEMDLKWQLALLSMRARRNPRSQESMPRNHDHKNMNQDSSRRTANLEETAPKEMVAIDGAGFDWSFMAEEEVTTNMALMAFSDSEKNEVMFCDQIVVLKRDTSFKDSEIIALKRSQISNNNRKGVGYNVVPPPPTGLFAPLTIDLSNSGLEEFQQPGFQGYGPKVNKSVCVDTSTEVKTTLATPLVEELVSEKKKQTVFLIKIEFVKQQDKTARKLVKVNYNYTTNKTHPNAQKNMVPRSVLMKTSLKPFNNARTVNTAHPKSIVFSAKPISFNTVKAKAVNTARPKAVNTVRPHSAVVNAVRANQANTVKAPACWVWRPTKPDSASITLKKHNYIDARGISKSISRSLMEDMLPLVEESEEERSLVKMCDKKNCVLFTDTACFVLSLDFKLLDESQILLKIPRKNNMYSVDMKNIVPKESLTCLVAKATLDESMLWHRRLGHVNFKTINKLVKDNLVRGLPSKRFENDQTCVACLKGKQHKASCKSKVQNSITQPLFMLHMDLFGPTFVSSLMNKKYCLVVTDDYSRFTWVFFLASKDETSGILKNFITEIENLVDKKVKIIRCDNGTEFKNRVMNEFCEQKGIKREYSVARTPQQNGVAERRNRTLIEAARTMLADSKLPTTFWAEAVNTACYVQNRVLIVKPHNKTPYELFRGRTPALSFMRPFGCHVSILNTLDHLGKFDGKSDDGFFVGYSLTSKAFRVYNIRTKRVEENLHIRFLEDKPIVSRDGPKWLFDLDSLTKSMNYVPVIAGTNSNDFAGSEVSVDEGSTSKKTNTSQDYIVMPLWKDSSLFDTSSMNVSHDESEPSCDTEKKDDEGVSKASEVDDQERPESSTPNINTVGPSINTASANPRTGSLHINTVSPTVITTRSNRPQSVSDIFSLRDNVTPEATNADLFGDETEMDMSNLNASYQVPTTLNSRIHKDHSLDHVIGDIQSGVQTRGMTKTANEQGFLKPKRVTKALSDSAWVEAMQEVLLQFKLQNVWVLVDLPKGKRAIDYDEVFAPVARIEAIKLFLAYASFMGFMVYQMDVKSAFLYGQIAEEVYVCQPPGFEDPNYPDKVYKVYVDDIIFGSTKKELCLEFEKLMHEKFQMSSMGELTFFLGLQVKQKADGIFISQDKYATDILKKFNFQDIRPASTPMDTEKHLLKDSDGDNVDVHLYRSMIGSLMYLTSSRSDIMFAVCACARFQVTPKVSHSHAVKRIFRYLKGKPKLGLWYPRDSSFDLVAYSDSNYAGASLDRKSTTGGCQFLGCRLISW
ncbi:putative ribonuclease H-like domain-containing protein [Tanacetum coccineum]